MMGSFVGSGNQYIQLVKVLYCNLPTIGKRLPTFPHKVRGLNYRPQRWEGSVLPLHHRDLPIHQTASSSFRGGGNQCILVGQAFACEPSGIRKPLSLRHKCFPFDLM